MPTIVPVIMCGGSGSRLWPASRETYPKQLFAFGGGRSLFQETVARVTGDAFGPPIVVTGNDYRFLVAEQLRDMGTGGDIVLEPMRRDSCAAIAAAAHLAVQRGTDPVLLVLAADHAIPDPADFRAHVMRGLAAAEAGCLVTFGIRPRHPATGFGYIRPGAALDGTEGVRRVEAFVEKPDEATARRYLADGYLWNSGNFLFRAGAFLAELRQHAPEIHDAVGRAVAGAARDLDFLRLEPEAFAASPARPVDIAVMEKTGHAAVVPSDFAWSDIGSWSAVWDMAEKDEAGNAREGDVVFEASQGCYAYSPELLVTVVGLKDVVTVATRDAVLVAAKDRSEDVKALVGRLGGMGRSEAVEHLRHYRPWGRYEQIDRGRTYQVKRITVAPGGVLSLQSHRHRSEHWVVVSGTARVTVDGAVRDLHVNESTYIPLGARHRLENPGTEPLDLIEVQCGDYLGEDDIVRYEDVYNR